MTILKRDEREIASNKPNLDAHNGLVPKASWINWGMYMIKIKPNGKAQIYEGKGKSFVKNAQGCARFGEMRLDEAIDKVRGWMKYAWEHNDKDDLCNEYGWRESFVKEFFGYCGYGIDDGPCPWNEE